MPKLPITSSLKLPALSVNRNQSNMADDNPKKILQRGIEKQRDGEFQQAEYFYQTVLRTDPKNALALNLLGTLAIEAKRYDVAIDLMSKAVVLDKNNAIFRNNLGNTYNVIGDIKNARVHLEKAVALDPNFIEPLCNLGRSYLAEMAGDKSEPFFRRALAIDPRSTDALTGLGDLLIDLGRNAEAVDIFRQVLELDDGSVAGLCGYASAEKVGADDLVSGQIEKCLMMPRTTEAERVRLHHAAGKVANDQKRYADAIGHFSMAKEILGSGFHIALHTETYDHFIKDFDATFFAERAHFGDHSDRPVFIVGMPRSGTTLTEQICASHPDIYGAGELGNIRKLAAEIGFSDPDPAVFVNGIYNMSAEMARELGGKFLNFLDTRNKTAKRVIDKMPHNYELLGFIKLILPNAHIIHCTRNPMDNCVSCFMQLFSETHGYNTNLDTLGKYYLQYTRLMAHWESVLPQRIHTMNYESTVSDLETQARAVIDFIGIPWNKACLRFYETKRTVKTPSRWQVRQPIYTGSVSRWRRYGETLNPLQRSLGNLAPKTNAE